MKKITLLMVGLLAATATAATIITPDAVGSIGYMSVAGLFDAQPASVPTPGPTEDNMGAGGGFYTTAGRTAWFDFGANYANLDPIVQVIMGLKQYGTDPAGTPVTFWSSTNDHADYNPGGGDILAPNMFWNWTGDTGDKSWQVVWSGSEDIQQRYLMLAFDGTQTASNRPQEIVFVGDSVPEPMTMSLLAIGGVALLKRRKK